jgi:hypothetical protein
MKNKNIKYDKISLGHFNTVKPRKKKNQLKASSLLLLYLGSDMLNLIFTILKL